LDEKTMEWVLLSALSEAQRREVLARCARRKFKKGEAIIRAGDAGDALYLVASGTVAVRVISPRGSVATIDVLRPGDAFGEQALISDGEGRTATVAALEPCETLRLTRAEFELLLAEHPGVLRLLVEVLEARLRTTTQDLVDALCLPVETRVYRRLAKLAEIYASRDAIPLTQDDLASIAGTTRQSLNKVLRRAQEDGLVVLNRGQVSVLDTDEIARRSL
jgi:CRP-like cAMP-binding protein